MKRLFLVLAILAGIAGGYAITHNANAYCYEAGGGQYRCF